MHLGVFGDPEVMRLGVFTPRCITSASQVLTATVTVTVAVSVTLTVTVSAGATGPGPAECAKRLNPATPWCRV